MRFAPAFFIAWRTLVGRSSESGGRNYLRGAVLGVALSLVPLVVVMVVADGMIEGITARYIEMGTYHIQAMPLIRLSQSALSETAATLGTGNTFITAAYAEIQGAAVALGRGSTSGVFLRAVEPRFFADPGLRSYLRTDFGKAELENSDDIVLGEALASNLGVLPGDLINIATARSPESTDVIGFSPKLSTFRIKGIVSSGYRELDSLWAFIPIKTGSRILAPESSRSFIGIKTLDAFGRLEREREKVITEIDSSSQNKGKVGISGFPEWSVSLWSEVEANLFKSFSTTRALLLLIMALAVTIAAINVGSALIMLVLERRRDIAILKSSGASPSNLGLVFVIAGLLTGSIGTILGLGLGSLIAWKINEVIAGIEAVVNVVSFLTASINGNFQFEAIKILDPGYYLEHIPVIIDPVKIAALAILSLLLCFLASLIPARRAAKLAPLEILRKS